MVTSIVVYVGLGLGLGSWFGCHCGVFFLGDSQPQANTFVLSSAVVTV